MAAVSRGRGWFHVKPMAKVPPGVLHKSLQTELSTEPVSSGCRMNVDGLSFPEVDPSCAVAREDELDATAMWILEVGRRVRRVRWDGRRAAEADVRGTCACFGEGGSSAVHWGSTANPIVATCTAGLKGQAWCALPGGCGPVSRETSSESPKDRSRTDSVGGSHVNASGVHSGLRERDALAPSLGELPVLCRAMNTTWDLMHALTRRTEFCSARDCMSRVSSLGTELCSRL